MRHFDVARAVFGCRPDLQVRLTNGRRSHALAKITNALKQQASQIFPPATPALKKRTWLASLPQKEQRSRFHSAESGSGAAADAGCGMVNSSGL
ncbi:MAG TPA: hypothetical protein VGM04_03100 [Sphingomicrobium sp.]|jgi:hypothetical protein